MKLPRVAKSAPAEHRSDPVHGSAPRAAPGSQPEAPQPPTPRPLPAPLRVAATPPDLTIVLYGLASCSVCQAARRHLDRRGLSFVEHDVGRDSAAAARALRLNPRRVVPTIDLGGREVLLGFTPEEFDAAFERALVPTKPPVP